MERGWEMWERLGKANLLLRLAGPYDGITNPVRGKIAEFLAELPVDERKILDVGCGPGIEYLAIEEVLGQDFDYTGIDVTPTQITIAKERVPEGDYPNAKFSIGDIFNIPNDDICIDDYDVVISKNVLEHLPPKKDNEVLNYKVALSNLAKFNCKYLILAFHLGLGENTVINHGEDGFYRNCYGAEEINGILNDNGMMEITLHLIQTLHREKKAVLLWCRR